MVSWRAMVVWLRSQMDGTCKKMSDELENMIKTFAIEEFQQVVARVNLAGRLQQHQRVSFYGGLRHMLIGMMDSQVPEDKVCDLILVVHALGHLRADARDRRVAEIFHESMKEYFREAQMHLEWLQTFEERIPESDSDVDSEPEEELRAVLAGIRLEEPFDMNELVHVPLE